MDTVEKVLNKKRLIDADVLWCKLESEHWYDNADRDEIALPLVDEVPTVDAVEVVRCENCINRDNKSGICMEFRQRYPFYPSKDFYCGFGKKKE